MLWILTKGVGPTLGLLSVVKTQSTILGVDKNCPIERGEWWNLNPNVQASQEVLEPLGYPSKHKNILCVNKTENPN